MHTLAELEAVARARVAAVADDPEGRLRLREDWYRHHGLGTAMDPYGFGTSELAFMRWEIDRGVLAPVNGARPGSPWWRKVNATLLYHAELAGLVWDAQLTHELVAEETRAFLDYLAAPSSRSWYRAHNCSIVRGYLDSLSEARAEGASEQLFMNEVLYRLLYAEALVTGLALGELGTLASDPRLCAVDVLVRIPALYPRHYPLTPADVINVEHRGTTFGEDLALALDTLLILPHLEKFYQFAARTLGQPGLLAAVKDGRPVYPHFHTPAAATATATAAPKKKIAILGAGAAALGAAWELTRHPDWASHYDVTVYTLGWRVGGKTATGRGPYARIEEHGIHILQGWYDETFRLLDAIFTERRERGLDPRSPFQRWEDGFLRDDSTLITEFVPGRGWVSWPLILPPNEFTPGKGGPLPVWAIAKKLVGAALEVLLGSPYQKDLNPIAKWILDHFFPSSGHDHPAAVIEPKLSAFDDAVSEVQIAVIREVLDLLKSVLSRVQVHLSPMNPPDDGLRRIALLAELTWVNLVGILEDVWDPETHTFEWSRIDHLDYREWIRSHGASETLALSPPVRFLYTGTFSNLVGESDAGGAVAAGTALRFLVQSAGYKGSFVWRFKSGTGDTMIMPLYEVLVARGVRFELFRDVQQVHWSDTGAIERVTVGEQVTLRNGVYEPTIRVGDVRAWPGHPLYDQIDPEQAQVLRQKNIDLESPWADWKCPVVRTLQVGTDFDHLVLAIPVGTLRTICSEIVEKSPAWRAMVEGVRTTATMSMQLWVKPTLAELGMDLAEWGLNPDNSAPNAVVYASPMYSWLDSSQVLPYERWPNAGAPQVVAYFTGAMSDPAVIPPFTEHHFPELALERLRGLTEQWLWDNMGFFWPKATRPEAPNGFDPMLLAARPEDRSAAQKLAFQFYRANLDPWQRYTLSAPGTAKHRLKTDASGFSNLFLAGDWIDFGMNVGYIEGAFVSGFQAGAALRRSLGL